MSDFILEKDARDAVESVMFFTSRFFIVTNDSAKRDSAFTCLVYASQIGVEGELHYDIQHAAFEYWTKMINQRDWDISIFDNCSALHMSNAISDYKQMEEFAT